MYELCLLLVCKIRIMCLFVMSLVVVTPTGPLYIAINTSRTINCSVPDGGLFVIWNVVFQNSTIVNVYDVPGFMFTRTTTSSSLTINNMDTSIIGLQCCGFLTLSSFVLIATRINLTIYGMLIL